jgi:hypothetical protein
MSYTTKAALDFWQELVHDRVCSQNKTATYRVAVGIKTAGICWQAATTATQQLTVLTHHPTGPLMRY